ncbi:hypothetical protein OK142_00040 [Agrobacterium sp. BT-220-3]|nr:hypothetical protein [Agrobacterium sp. BT-220-3]
MTNDNGNSRDLKESGITDVLRFGGLSRMSSFVIISGDEKAPQNVVGYINLRTAERVWQA